jgi:predicted dinucleotide-binding enzyme
MLVMAELERRANMRIGIIGAGQIGSTLARKLTKLGHSVRLANSRGPASLTALARETGAAPVMVGDAIKDVELVVVTIPEKSVPALQGLFRDVAPEVVVVDTGNYYPSFRDGEIAAIESGSTESGWVAKQLGRPVVKAFNSIMAPSLAEGGAPPGTKGRIALPVAGDDPRAKRAVLDLVDALGFDGVDGGSLDESWRQEPGTPAYCTDLDRDGVRRALAQADRSRSHAMREKAIAQMQAAPKGTIPRDFVLLARAQHGIEGP